jgi:peptide/nickel transport system ATP-binding protein
MSGGRGKIVEVRGLNMGFPGRRSGFRRPVSAALHVLRDIDLDIENGETLGLVGESGSGKSTLGRCLLGLYRPYSGRIDYHTPDRGVVDIATLGEAGLRPCRREIRMIFQDPFTSLNPRLNALQIVGDPLRANGLASGSEREDRVATMLHRVGISPDKMRRFPHAFSGGERQRICIARALIVEPRLVIADEAVSALDVSIRGQILELLAELRADLGLTYLFISHDLSVVEHFCDRVAVLLKGEIVELADSRDLYRSPQHAYTRELLSAVPIADPRLRRQRTATVARTAAT